MIYRQWHGHSSAIQYCSRITTVCNYNMCWTNKGDYSSRTDGFRSNRLKTTLRSTSSAFRSSSNLGINFHKAIGESLLPLLLPRLPTAFIQARFCYIYLFNQSRMQTFATIFGNLLMNEYLVLLVHYVPINLNNSSTHRKHNIYIYLRTSMSIIDSKEMCS